MKSNLDPKLESALCYVPFIGWVAAIIFVIIEKDKTVRFDAVQSLVFNLVTMVVNFVLGITLILAILTPFIWLGTLVVQIVLAYKAYQGQKVVLPLLGKWSEDILVKMTAK